LQFIKQFLPDGPIIMFFVIYIPLLLLFPIYHCCRCCCCCCCLWQLKQSFILNKIILME